METAQEILSSPFNGSASTVVATVTLSDLAPRVGSYGVPEFVVDTVLVTVTMVTITLALIVFWKSRMNCCLLDYTFLIELVSGMVLTMAYYLPQAAQVVGIWSKIRKDSFACQLFGSIMVTLAFLQIMNALFFTSLRLLSIKKPFLYDRWFAFNTKLAVPAAILHVLLPTCVVIATATYPLDVRLYNGICLLDFREGSSHTLLLVLLSIGTTVLVLLFVLHAALGYTFRQLSRPPTSIKSWDESLQKTSALKEDGRAEDDGDHFPKAKPSSQVTKHRKKSASVGFGLIMPALTKQAMTLRPLHQSFSNTDIPSSVHSIAVDGGQKPADGSESKSATQPDHVNETPATSTRKCRFLRRCHSQGDLSHRAHGTKHGPGTGRRRLYGGSLHALQLLHHRVKMSPLTRLTLALSLTHVVSKLPGVVICWLELQTKSSPVSFFSWTLRFFILASTFNSFLFVLARRTYKTEVDRLFKPLQRYLRRVTDRIYGNRKRRTDYHPV
ncbi:uncharacterized protein LOC135825251 [Sycon ciliatum]|uniref:uncharacterized protein LOC135825251 n=1 Tax=Sycon ciliatum TaxID=27933 RepID=UPI0031F6F7D0